MTRKASLPYARGSATSLAAAESMLDHEETGRQRVYDYICAKGIEGPDRGATDNEIGIAIGMIDNTVVPRRVDLMESSLIMPSGLKRKTSSGRDAVVWIKACEGYVYVPPPKAPTKEQSALILAELRRMSKGFDFQSSQHFNACVGLVEWLKHRANPPAR